MPELEGGNFSYEAIRMYNDIRRVPLMIRLPGQTESQRIDGMVQSPVDLMPDHPGYVRAGIYRKQSGVKHKSQMLQCGMFTADEWEFDPKNHPRQIVNAFAARRKQKRHRDLVVSSNTIIHHSPVLAKCAVVTEDGWCLHYAGTYDEISSGGKMYTNVLVSPLRGKSSYQTGSILSAG